jgi:hypothetical protein
MAEWLSRQPRKLFPSGAQVRILLWSIRSSRITHPLGCGYILFCSHVSVEEEFMFCMFKRTKVGDEPRLFLQTLYPLTLKVTKLH